MTKDKTEIPNRKLFVIHVALVAYGFLIATSFPVGAVIADNIDPALLTFFRFSVASMVLLTVAVARGEFVAPTWSLIGRTGSVAVIMAVFFTLMFEALRSASALNTGAIFTLAPLLSLILDRLINKQRANRLQLVCLCIGALGAMWIVFDGSLEKFASFSLGTGEVIFLCATAFFGLYAPTVKRVHRGEPMIYFTFWILFLVAVLTGSYALVTLETIDLSSIPGITWSGILYLAVFSTAITFFIAVMASSKIAAFKVTSYVYLVPVFVALIDNVLRQEAVPPIVLVGIFLTTSVTFLLQR